MNKQKLQVVAGALGVYLIDATSKAWIIRWLAPGDSIVLIPGVFQLTRLQNTGAAFSLFHQYPQLLTLVASLLLVAFFVYMWRKAHLRKAERVSFSFILGGAFGNLMDRLRLGAVTDFLDFVLIHYPVFNLADSFIFVGILLLLGSYVRASRTLPGA